MMEFNFVGIAEGFQSLNVGDTKINGFEVSIAGQGNLFGWETSLIMGYTYLNPRFKEFGFDADPESDAFQNASNSSLCNDPEDPEKLNCENILKYRSRHSAKMDFQMTRNKFSIGMGATFDSQMVSIDTDLEGLVSLGSIQAWRKQHQHGDLILSARLGYQVKEFMKVSLVGDNITNREYVSRPGQLQSPANIALRMDFDF